MKRLLLSLAVILVLTGISGAYYRYANADVAGSALFAWWTLDSNDISGTTVTDNSGNGKTCTTSGSPPPTTGKLGQALTFNVTTPQWLVCNSFSLPAGARTYTVWIKPSSFVAFSRLFENGGGVTGIFGADNSTLWARFDGPNSNGVNWNSPSVLVTGKWQFAAVVLTDTSLQFYYNGKPFDSLKTFGSNQAWAVSTLYIANRGAGDRPFYGVVDDPRVYNRALSDAEVNQIYNHSLPKYHGGL